MSKNSCSTPRDNGAPQLVAATSPAMSSQMPNSTASLCPRDADASDKTKIFSSPQRKALRINPIAIIFKISIAFGLVGALVAGYCTGLKLLDLKVTTAGLYGVALVTVYLIQLFCAITNRVDINRIAKSVSMVSQGLGDCERAERQTQSSVKSEVSIVVVGYREDEQAWRQCLRSLQRQTVHSKCVISVVDGNEKPDLDMANAFVSEFEQSNAPLIQLPLLLSDVHRKTYYQNLPEDGPLVARVWRRLIGRHRPGHVAALAVADRAVMRQVSEWDTKWNIRSLNAVCFSQPHGHKRTAMFTGFAMALYALRTRDAIFTTDSDTLVHENGLHEMLTLLDSDPDIGGVTADVKIWNRSQSFLARLCSARYWFAFNIERACQSLWRCVGCLSGPMSMYRACDLDTILGPWNLQTFGGMPTTFGDDRHLTNQLLAHGLKTRYTHRTWCDSESPTTFVRWVVQQTRWSKSFYREAFWFPISFAYQSPWLIVETVIQSLYPFVLAATVFRLLFDTAHSDNKQLLVWLVTMFSVSLFKSIVGVLLSGDLWLLLFSCYGFIYFFGLLPSKMYAMLTMHQTGWGTSARSSSERKRGQSFLQRTFLVCHLIVWYTAVFVGVGFFLYRIFDNPFFILIGVFALLPSAFLYWQDSVSLHDMRESITNRLRRRKPRGDSTVETAVAP
ncbi:hypothetical protein MY1884_009587 [Beauveria asiatica]